jgi:hypothetical protein
LRAALAWTLLALACRSSAPYTLPSAVLNSAIAVQASAISRAAGGCYSPCSPGYVCNPVTGFCEQDAPVCVGESNDPRCPPPTDVPIGTQRSGAGSGSSPAPAGVSPSTGRAPSLPGERPPPGL